MFDGLCRATYCSVVPGIYFDAWCITCCPKREETPEVYSAVVMAYICYIYFDAWCITCCSKREETLEVYTVIGEVLVLGLLVVVWKIPYSGCILNTAVVMEAGKMVCGYHTAVYLVHGSCMCYTWYVLVVSPDVVDIGSESFVVYLSCVYYVRLVMPSYLLFCCTRVSTSMLGIAHAVQNERKLWNFTQ